jgi:hypothetical protein
MNEKVINDRLQTIEEKLEEIAKKTSEKWLIPVLLAVLTTFLGMVNFYIERNVNKTDISINKQKEIIGEYIAKSKIEFFKESKIYLNTIDEQFESYCNLGISDVALSDLDSTLISLRKFLVRQQVNDTEVLSQLSEYSEYISEISFKSEAEKYSSTAKAAAYKQSRIFYVKTSRQIDSEIELLQGQ